MIRNSLLVVAALTAVADAQPGAQLQVSGDASAQVNLDQLVAQAEAAAPSIETVVRGTVRRARRAISIGPTVGLWSAAIIDPGDIDAALTFGIGFETFKVPVLPDIDTLRALIQERVKAQLKDRIKAVFQGRPPDPLELNAIAAQVYLDVRDEILGVKNVRGKTMERPQFTVGFEANRLFGAERWLGRTRVGIGVWKVTLALSTTVGRVCRGAGCDDNVKVFIGPEVVAHFMTSKSPRASVIDAFLRADFQANGRGIETYDQLTIGVRYLLDLI
ncbi:MAG TPA: hypothetical protein VFV99_15110 [Kofleriaceae bacterium]|nr:hypothetical protein [Kofleriaceae bacterium]